MNPPNSADEKLQFYHRHGKDVVASPLYCVDRHGKTTYQGDESTNLRWGDARA